MTYGQAGAVCPQCGSAAAVHSVDELAAMARGPARAVRAGVSGAAAGIPATAGISGAASPGYQPPPGSGPPPPSSGFPSPSPSSGFPSAPLSSDFPAPPATAAGLFGLGAAAGIQRPAASQPVVQR